VALGACVQARNEGRDLAAEGPDILKRAARQSAELAAALETWREIRFEFQVVLSGVQMPRMSALMKRWVQTCRREMLDRTLIWNQRHLLYALREFEQFS
jgi:hypothetical protein